MLKDITVGQYYPSDSPIHRLDPRTKLVITFLFIITIFFVRYYSGYIFVLAFMALTVALSRIPIRYILKGLRPLIFIILLTFFINVFFTPGETLLFSFWFLRVTEEGLRQGLFMGLRLIFLVTGTSLLTLTTSPIALTDGIELLLKPLRLIRFPSHELAMMMTIALRFIPTLLEETDKIMKAQMARGADFESGNLIQRAKSLVPLLVPLFISAFRRADELAMAMEARCYRGGDNRTRMKVLTMGRIDFAAYVVTAALIASVLLNTYL
ncbi:MAG: energy-coupling factor transporter transmembrane component T family protein [Caldicoprobacterales bacterium]|jgi:energy-coupling factor transport system permease protein|nr:energy-coupling factor transporter transmembrane protein EcfT [Clostridiales bacterium]